MPLSGVKDRFFFLSKPVPNKVLSWSGAAYLLCSVQYTVSISNGILLPKLFRPTVRKNCSSDREKKNLLKFEAEGQDFVKLLRSLEQFIQTVEDQNNVWWQNAFFGGFSDLINSNNSNSNWKRVLGIRNIQEKLEKIKAPYYFT